MGGYNQRNAKVDKNQPEIVEGLRRIGAKVKPVHQLKKFCDIMVGYRGKLFMMEIKSGDDLPKKYSKMTKKEKRSYLEAKLSEGEKECMEAFQSVGVVYHIVSTLDEAISILNENTETALFK